MLHENIEVSSFILSSYMHFLNGNNELVEKIGTDDLKIPSFSEEILMQLCNHAIDILKQTNKTLINIPSPSIVVGDLHGNLHDLIRIINSIIDIFSNRVLFLGDYVDRGQFQIETITLLLALRIEYPNNFFLIRGNHEFTDVNASGGFRKEILESGYSESLFEKFNEVFYWLPISAVINNRIFCIHGGLSPLFSKIDQIVTDFQLPIKTIYTKNVQKTRKRRQSSSAVSKPPRVPNPTFSDPTDIELPTLASEGNGQIGTNSPFDPNSQLSQNSKDDTNLPCKANSPSNQNSNDNSISPCKVNSPSNQNSNDNSISPCKANSPSNQNSNDNSISPCKANSNDNSPSYHNDSHLLLSLKKKSEPAVKSGSKLPPISPSPIPKLTYLQPLHLKPASKMSSSPTPTIGSLQQHHRPFINPKSLHLTLHLNSGLSYFSDASHIESTQSSVTPNIIDQFQIENEADDKRNNIELLTDLLWSDPTDSCQASIPSNRGSGCYFGSYVTNTFLNGNMMKMIVRGHESILNGVETHHDRKVVTVYSSSSIKSNQKCGCIIFDTNDKYKSFRLNPIVIVPRKEAKFFTPALKQSHRIETFSISSIRHDPNNIRKLSKLHKGMRNSYSHVSDVHSHINPQ